MMFSRRRLVVNGLATAALAALPARAQTPRRAIAGAIRWDAWYDSENRAAVEASLGPAQWQPRAPWFARVLSPMAISIDGDRQSIIDAEIAYAAAAGLRYWAYVWYGPDDGMQHAWRLHQSSMLRDRMNWCLLWQFTDLAGSARFARNLADTVGYFKQANYQKVLGGRPLLYLFVDAPAALGKAWGGDWFEVRRALEGLGSACRSAGIARPYLVVMFGAPAKAAEILDQIGGDAISNYTGPVPHGAPVPYEQLDASVRRYWVSQAKTGKPVVPIAMLGWDRRPREEHPPPWEPRRKAGAKVASYVTAGTVTERASHLRAAVDFIADNAAICPSTALLIYSWNECDEGGGCLCPSLGDPPPSAFLRAVRRAIA